MSKAFTKEDEGTTVPPVARKRGVPVPELNMVTPRGLATARAELEELTRNNGDADRVHELAAHLATAQAVDPPVDRGEVALGAIVEVEADSGKRTTYRIVGAIEADPRRGALGWQSPLAEVLYGARVGDTIELPNGDEVTVMSVAYD